MKPSRWNPTGLNHCADLLHRQRRLPKLQGLLLLNRTHKRPFCCPLNFAVRSGAGEGPGDGTNCGSAAQGGLHVMTYNDDFFDARS